MFSPTIYWSKGSIKLIDQTKLPHQLIYIHCRDLKTLWEAIKSLRVRGAPAIGMAGAFGVLLAAKQSKKKNLKDFIREVNAGADYLATSRPTAVNLFHGINEMRMILKEPVATIAEAIDALQQKANALYEHDRYVCRQIGMFGQKLIKANRHYMTICNAGALATVDYGTALSVFFKAKEKKRKFHVYACETRPLLQGARLTTWELLRAKIPVTLICDNMAASVMNKGKLDGIFVGADRIAANGDTANKIGTYNLAVLAKYHHVPFYVVAPLSTIDLKTQTGKQIPIEERSAEEVCGFGGIKTAPSGVNVYNPAFDVTDASLITGIITEKGIVPAPYGKNIAKLFK